MERETFFDTLYSPAKDKAEIAAELSAAMEIAKVVNSRLDLDHILSRIARELGKVIEYDIGCVALNEPKDNCLYIRHIHRKNGDTSSEGRYVPLEENNLIGWVAVNKKPILRKDVQSDRRFDEIMKEDIGSDIVVPLIAKDTLIGTLNIGSYRKNAFSDFHLDLVEKFSQLTSIAIENSQLVERYRELGEKYRKLMKHASDIIMILSVSGEIVECNDIVYRKFGYTSEEVLGKSFWMFTEPERRDSSRANFAGVLRGDKTEMIEVPYVKRNGEIAYLDISAIMISIGEHPYVLTIGHDVTERKILQERVTIQNRHLRDVNRKLTELDKMKSEFLGRISHELRTPLSVIMAYTGTLIEEGAEAIDPETRKDFLGIIDDQSNKLLRAINDLLDLSKVEISETMLNITEASVNEIAALSVMIAEPYAMKNEVTLNTDFDKSLPITRFDPLRIRQVCVNLINNAIKFTPPGGVVTVSTSMNDGCIRVSVRDEGPGIESEDIEEIFDFFTQLDGGTSRCRNGMGIGLRLVQHYVKLHRGSVWVEKGGETGSVFNFSLPVSAPSEICS